jgi:chromosome segregation protein
VDAARLLERDQAALTDLDQRLAQDEPALLAAEEDREAALEGIEVAEAALKIWEAQWDDLNREAAGPAQQAQLERARINHLEQRLGQDRVPAVASGRGTEPPRYR